MCIRYTIYIYIYYITHIYIHYKCIYYGNNGSVIRFRCNLLDFLMNYIYLVSNI